MREIQKDPDLELILFVGASALLDKYGEMVETIKKDGFPIAEYIYMLIEGENPTTMAKSTGLGLMEISNLLFKHQPDVCLAVGDRHEMFAFAIASAFLNIPLAHTMGGEVSGTIDESIRHSITKLAHLHFPATELAKQNIIKMGEDPKMVFNFGCPRIDTIKEILITDYSQQINELTRKEGVGDIFSLENGFLLVSQHPVTTEFGQGEFQITQTLKAVQEVQKEKGMPVIMLWPNADAGSDEISQGIRKFREKEKPQKFHIFKNLPLEIYVHLMDRTKCLVGNSSSGIREGAFIGTPTVNIGTREQNRQQGQNVLNVSYSQEEIKKAILLQIEHGKYPQESIYGSGNTSQKIIQTIKNTKINIQKHLWYF